ncbi:RTA1 like protein-domain-containing protein [Mycena polygramma]|nr:RTA1 like protein-domain-containing protein [Mycena polygramma]
MYTFAPLERLSARETLYRLANRDDANVSGDDSAYGYVPQEAVAILFLVLFGISTILHVGQATYFRMWWLLPTAALCGVGELIGWGARLWSANSPTAWMPFTIQICCTGIAPTPLLAATFILFARIVEHLGTSYSRLTPRLYTIIFLSCDTVALVVQGVGCGLAASAQTLDAANQGARIMLGGIAFQFAVIVVFYTLAIDFMQRYIRDKPVRAVGGPRGVPGPRLTILLGALAFSTTTLFIRPSHGSVYRIIELTGGWNGRIIHTEVYFNVLDGGMVVLAIFALNFAHPGVLLQHVPTKEETKLESLDASREGSV